MKIADQSFMKDFNKSTILNTIKTKGPIPRSQISEITGLNKATISGLVNELIQEKFIEEIGLGQSNGGRRPIMLYFNNNAGYSIGLDIGVNYILGILTDLQGKIITEEKTPIDNRHFTDVLAQVKKIIKSLITKKPLSPYGIIGIGIGVPAIINEKGKILFAPNLGWENVEVKYEIENEFNVPVVVENEANAGSHGEKFYGSGQDASNLIYISVGVGVGAGIIINDNLYKGASGIAGEMGHITIDPKGKKCNCGNRGCWELYASEHALLSQAKNLISYTKTKIDIELLIDEANSGNLEIINLLSRIGEYIGIGLVSITNMFNPQIIIIGNQFSKIENWIKNSIDRTLYQSLRDYHYNNLQIKFSQMGIYSCALGSSALSVSNFISDRKIQ